MSLQQKIKNIVFYYIKIHYKNYLNENNLKYIPDNDIENVINDFYKNESKNLKQFIRNTLEKMMENDYPGALVENIIYEIFEDEDFAKKRVIMEIKMYQDNNKDSLNNEILNNSYEVYLKPNKVHGLGLIINIEDEGIYVKDFKKIDNYILPAQNCNMIHIGDKLIKINDHDLNKMSINDSIELLKNYNSKTDQEITLQFLNKIKIHSN
jgi:C-terminal processing protease CtpA/Prc